ncbi:aspergillopepsin [Athelia psychrophila]|uniref:Aspergillopepsin n=1 Tax=Athelia psychrophila TaxID=1759441 RepID=A0A166HLX1_9AGAM|nr:aspergillopepsin [Fibularhizoctonia sp. CBS 109695]KZP19004.1 aspergillopepsin [Fibularhizoctonia sp. CBS 109695]
MVAIQFLASLLLGSAVIAAPSSTVRRAERAARRGQPNIPAAASLTPAVSNSSNVGYSTNWAGAVWDSYPAGTFKSVTGTFKVPTPTGSSGSASAWVGIDGDTCGSAILQTGIDFTIDGGDVSYDAWYEWYPAVSTDFSGISFSAGDSVTLTVTATSTKAGSAVIENNTTGKKVTKSLTSSSALCQQNAEWIVEDFEEGSSLVKFADFDEVVFTGATAKTISGDSVGPSGATLLDIKQSSKVLTSVSATTSGLTVKYV